MRLLRFDGMLSLLLLLFLGVPCPLGSPTGGNFACSSRISYLGGDSSTGGHSGGVSVSFMAAAIEV